MSCTSVRSTVSLTAAGHAAWFASHLRELSPAICTWGRHRFDTSRVFGEWFDRMHTTRLSAVAHGVDFAGVCQAARARAGSKFRTVAAWSALYGCS